LLQTIASQVSPGRPIALPLSAGLDSRAILGGLLEARQASAIDAITFGIPGATDYEAGTEIAKAVGLRHQRIDLTELPITLERLAKTALRTDGNVVLFQAYVHTAMSERLPGHEFWVGFLGEVLAGNDIVGQAISDLETRAILEKDVCGELWQQHQSAQADHTMLLLLLASLEIILRTFNVRT